jgi:hypothetical protein
MYDNACMIKDLSSRKTWAFGCRTKDNAKQGVEDWHKRVTTHQPKLQLAIICMDNGKLKSKLFEAWACSLGIEVQYTAPYTSAKNSTVKRMYCTIAGRACAMCIDAGLPNALWLKMWLTATFLANLLPTKALPNGMTPHKAFNHVKPNVSFLCKIGCQVFVLKQNKYNPKVFSRSHKGVFAGYNTQSKAYQIWCPSAHKIIVLCNIRFIESHRLAPHPWKTGNDATRSTNAATLPMDWPAPVAAEGDTPLPADNAHIEPALPPLAQPEPTPMPPPPPQQLLCLSPQTASLSANPKTANAAMAKRARKLVLEHIAVGEKHACKEQAARKPVFVDIALKVSKESMTPLETLLATVADTDESVGVDQLFGKMLDNLVLQAMLQDHEEQVNAAVEANELGPKPLTVKEALASSKAELWRQALCAKFASIKGLGVYKLIRHLCVPAGRRILKGKPVLKRKLNKAGEITRYKARWVAKGFLQVFGQDFKETASPTTSMESICILAHIATTHNLEIRKFSVKTVFLHGTLNMPIFMEQPPGFKEAGHPAKD